MEDSHEFRARWIGLDEDHHPKVKTLARWTEGWIKAACTNKKSAKTRWLVFSGSCGAGKTHALKRARSYIRAHGGALWPKFYQAPPNMRWVTWSKAVQLEKYGWDEFEEEVRQARMVFVDDIGSEVDKYKSGEPAERLRLFLDLCESKWLLGTTNVSRTSFSRVFDARAQSRLERAAVLDLSGVPDYRPKLQE